MTIELAILTPLFALLLAFVVLVGRVQSGRADVEAAAHSAARTISLARDADAGIETARRDAEVALGIGTPTCTEMSFSPSIADGRVTVEIACKVDLAAAALLPVPGSMNVSATAVEVIDRFREVGG